MCSRLEFPSFVICLIQNRLPVNTVFLPDILFILMSTLMEYDLLTGRNLDGTPTLLALYTDADCAQYLLVRLMEG